MTMHSTMSTTAVLFKEHQGINAQQSAIDNNNGPLLMWDAPPPPPPVVFGEDGQRFAKGSGNTTQHFTLFSGDPKAAENGEKTAASNMDYRRHLELGFGHPLQICAKYPYAEQCYGLYSTYGTQIQGRIMLPLSMNADGGPIYVNAKQYNGIMRRRKKRAEAELDNRVLRLRKPYLHLSRHLHAMRRPRGNGGRFLNTKSNSSFSNGKTIGKANGSRKAANDRLEEKQQQQLPQYHHPTDSQISEVLQSDNAMNNGNGSRSTSPGSEVTSTTHYLFSNKANNNNNNNKNSTSTLHRHHPFLQMNHHLQYPGSFHQGFQINHVANSTGLGIAMASGNYLKV